MCLRGAFGRTALMEPSYQGNFILCKSPEFAPDPRLWVQGERPSVVPYDSFTWASTGPPLLFCHVFNQTQAHPGSFHWVWDVCWLSWSNPGTNGCSQGNCSNFLPILQMEMLRLDAQQWFRTTEDAAPCWSQYPAAWDGMGGLVRWKSTTVPVCRFRSKITPNRFLFQGK